MEQARRKGNPKTGKGQSTANVIQRARHKGNPNTGNSSGEVQIQSKTARQRDNPRKTKFQGRQRADRMR